MASGLNRVRREVAAAAARAGRDPEEITLVAVSKAADRPAIEAAYRAGHRDFAENRAAALAERAEWLPSDARWHMVGRLQGNKVAVARPHTHLLHSLDREKLAGYWARGELPAPPVLLQVNAGGEDQKAGVAPGEAAGLMRRAVDKGLDVVGLMTMAPLVDDPELVRPVFRSLRELRDRLAVRWPQLRHLSMGMTDDYPVAVEEGATILRVGRAIFLPETGED